MNPESPFAHILHTNYAPSDYELQQLKQYLIKPTNKMLALDNEITRARAVLNTLCSERDKLNDDINAHRALMSPIRRVPRDILQEIFIACLPSDRNAVISAQEAPVLLGQICGTWREVSHTTPTLWLSIHIPIPPSAINDELSQKRYEAVKTWLGRSGNGPLSISIHYPRNLPQAADSCILMPVMNIIWSLSHRWRHICINMPPSQISNLLALTKRDVPLMESLRLNTIYRFGDSFDWKMLRIFQAPRLTSIFTDFMDQSVSALPLNWTNLTELSLYNCSNDFTGLAVNEALVILHKCPNLTVCRVAITAPNGSNHNTRYSVSLSQLHTLSVMEGRDVNVTELFSQLDLPSLRNVVFRTRALYSERPASLLTLMARSTHIESLDFEWLSNFREEFIECLRMAPYVIQLRIFIHKLEGGWGESYPSIFDDECLLPFLPILNNISGCLCPRLESLTCYNANFSDAMLLEFLNSRSDTTHPELARLKHMHASFDRSVKDELDVESFRREGMDISLSYQSPQFHHTAPLSPWAGLPADEN